MTLVLTSCTHAWGRDAEPVLRDFAYELPDGVTLLLGPQGAGKSTLLQLAAAEVPLRSGTITFDGEPVGSKAYRRAVGWMPDGVMPMTGLSARDFVAYVGWLKGMRRREAWNAAGQALERAQLSGQARRKTSRLTPDELARLGIATALVAGARVLLLDEPTAGLHLQHRETFQHTLATLVADHDVRVLLATRDVASLPALTTGKAADVIDHIAVLDTDQDDSAMLHTGTTAEFLAHAPTGTSRREAPAAALAAVVGEERESTTE